MLEAEGLAAGIASVSDGSSLTWPERAEHYRRVVGRSAFPGYEDGWAYGMWFLGNSWAVKSGYYGGYPQGYLKRLRALFPDKRRALPLFSGQVNVAEFPGDTCDINPTLNPTFIADAHTLEGVPIDNYDMILADPPYSAEDADHYGTPLAVAPDESRCAPRLAGSGTTDVYQGAAEARGRHWHRALDDAQIPLLADMAAAGLTGVTHQTAPMCAIRSCDWSRPIADIRTGFVHRPSCRKAETSAFATGQGSDLGRRSRPKSR